MLETADAFPVSFLSAPYLSTAIIPLRRRRHCRGRDRAECPARGLLPVGNEGRLPRPAATDSLKTSRRNLCPSRARARANRLPMHTLARIINTPICLHSSSYKVSRMLSSSVRPSVRALDSFGRRSIPPAAKRRGPVRRA